MNPLLDQITPERKTHYMNRSGKLIHKTRKRIDCEKTYLYLLEKGLKPRWFMSFHWEGRKIRTRNQVEKDTKHLKNVLLTSLLRIDSPRKIPSPPERPRCIFFHEKESHNFWFKLQIHIWKSSSFRRSWKFKDFLWLARTFIRLSHYWLFSWTSLGLQLQGCRKLLHIWWVTLFRRT